MNLISFQQQTGIYGNVRFLHNIVIYCNKCRHILRNGFILCNVYFSRITAILSNYYLYSKVYWILCNGGRVIIFWN
jgi:hypothetical protein